MPDAGEEVLAFPDTQARRLAGVSMRRLRYWEEVGLVVPSIKRRLSEHNTVRLYSYQDLLALLVVSALRTERNMSLQKIRRVVTHLRSRGYQAPLRELKFAVTDGKSFTVIDSETTHNVFSMPEKDALVFRYESVDKDRGFKLVKTYITDPRRNVMLSLIQSRMTRRLLTTGLRAGLMMTGSHA